MLENLCQTEMGELLRFVVGGFSHRFRPDPMTYDNITPPSSGAPKAYVIVFTMKWFTSLESPQWSPLMNGNGYTTWRRTDSVYICIERGRALHNQIWLRNFAPHTARQCDSVRHSEIMRFFGAKQCKGTHDRSRMWPKCEKGILSSA